ncbi:MAG TPA: 1-deoxy-D-xylulose-5-phosphate reductoisomerase [Pirellulales bacterium]|nr:1-deoxy-D-xylulose-5-phosphate reductoisomerase [Pirellulales bacterium]
MPSCTRKVAVLGSTGSIGKSTLDVIAASGGRLQAAVLSAHSNLESLAAQALQVCPRWVVATDARAAAEYPWPRFPSGVELLTGQEGIEQAVAEPEIDVVVAAIVGSAGLRGAWAALEAGKTLALANKETLVMAGPLVMDLSRRRGAPILPVDSEHCAVFQALQAGRRQDVRRIVLTASGGPFRKYTAEEMQNVTVADALKHPTWAMGKKITVDSATMMNKALEIIEARWLFDLEADQIGVVVHPQSVVHSMVEFVDGSVIAQMSPPDMKLPIQYALTYPERQAGIAAKFDWTRACQLEFEPADFERFPALSLGLEAARAGGTTGAVLNAANEAAVAGFLAGELKFTEIVPACRDVLDHHHFDPRPSLEQLIELDDWARREVLRWVCT